MATLATDTFTGSNGAAWNSQWTTSAGNGGAATFSLQSNTGQWMVSTGGTYPQAFLSGMAATSDCDLYCDFLATTNSVTNYLFFGISAPSATWFSGDPFFPDVGYGVQVTVATTDTASALKLIKCSSGYTVEGPVATVTVTAGTWYTIHLQRRSGTISAYLYTQGGTAPSSPQCTWTDSSPLGSGKVVVTGCPASTSYGQQIDNLTVTDGVTGNSWTASPTEALGITGTTTRVVTRTRSVGENLGITGVVSANALAKSTSATESAALRDTVSVVRSLVRTVTDAITGHDVAGRVTNLTVADSVTITGGGGPDSPLGDGGFGQGTFGGTSIGLFGQSPLGQSPFGGGSLVVERTLNRTVTDSLKIKDHGGRTVPPHLPGDATLHFAPGAALLGPVDIGDAELTYSPGQATLADLVGAATIATT